MTRIQKLQGLAEGGKAGNIQNVDKIQHMEWH